MSAERVSATGIPWYRPEHYEELRTLFVDGAKLPATYATWLAAAERGERQLTNEGRRVVRAELTPAAFTTWCRERRLTPDAQARMRFASEAAYRAVEDTTNN